MCTNMRLMKTQQGFFKYVPCKYLCTECRNMRREDFKQRLKFELKSYNYLGAFITLTYRDSDLPILLPEGSAVVGEFFGNVPPSLGSTLYRPDMSKFCDNMQKRLRRKFGRSGKYIGFGDYGEDGHRPHMHLIYVGCPVDRHLVYDTWKHGNVDVEPIGNGCIRYVLDYINKDPIFADSKYKLYGDFEPPFYHFSKGLGFEEIYKMVELGRFDRFGKTVFGDTNHTYTLPPYLKEKLGFHTKTNEYPDSVVEWAVENGYSDLDLAMENRSNVIEVSNERKKVARGGLMIDFLKAETNEGLERRDRFIGFTDYDKIDSLLGI